MKKISIFFASVLAMLCFASCEDDKEPVYSPASSDSFELLASPMQDQYLELTADGTFDVIAKGMPDFAQGHPVGPVKYSAEVALDPASFSIPADDPSRKANVVEIPAVNASSRLTFATSRLAEAVCTLKGLTKDDAGYVFTDTEKVYLRLICSVEGIENSTVASKNYITFNKVMPYFAIPSPGFIFLVGAPEGWAGPTAANAEHYEAWKLFEKDDEIDSKIYYGSFYIDAGNAMFRFYTQLSGWDNDSYGSQEDDNPLDCAFTDDVFKSKVVKGKGSFNFADWAGGVMDFKVDMSDMNNIQITITAVNE